MELERSVKELIIESLELEDITVDDIKDDTLLFAANKEGEETLGLDSIDSLELIVAFKKKFDIRITDENMNALQSVRTLVRLIEESKMSEHNNG